MVLINYFVVISLAKYVGPAQLASNEHSLTQGDRSLDIAKFANSSCRSYPRAV